MRCAVCSIGNDPTSDHLSSCRAGGRSRVWVAAGHGIQLHSCMELLPVGVSDLRPTDRKTLTSHTAIRGMEETNITLQQRQVARNRLLQLPEVRDERLARFAIGGAFSIASSAVIC